MAQPAQLSWLETAPLLRAGAPAAPGRWCQDPNQSGSQARIPCGQRAELGSGEAGTNPTHGFGPGVAEPPGTTAVRAALGHSHLPALRPPSTWQGSPFPCCLNK